MIIIYFLKKSIAKKFETTLQSCKPVIIYKKDLKNKI